MQALVCEACWTNIFDTEGIQKFWSRETYFSYNTTWARIKQSAAKGCNWCGFLSSVLPSPETRGWPNVWTITTDLTVVLDEADLVQNVNPSGLNLCQIDFCSEGSSCDWHVELDLSVDDVDGSAGSVTARPLQSVVNSPSAYSQVKQWLEQCKDHTECDKVPKVVNLPSRVIEVAPAGSSDKTRLRSTTGLKGSYLALSYCWGTDQTYVLTTQNLEMLSRELELYMLPQTILDAIEVAQNLGFKYLWVDALCIMQDTAETAARDDMERELAIMDQIYRNATMTNVAACAPAVTSGFLKDRPGPGQSRFDIPCRHGPEKFVIVHIQEHLMYDDKKEPVNARAWTFQEELISPRLLIYASHTLQWQCRTLTCNLGGSYHSPIASTAPRLPSPQRLLLESPESKLGDDQLTPEIPHAILQHWLRIVSRFSSRTSSLPSDKLPALSALAVSYAPIFGPNYFTGIWERSAVHQLCWFAPDRRRFFTRPTQYRAPSWSWAALDGPVYFPSFLLIDNASVCVPYHRFQIVEWQTSLKTSNLPYGEVTGGRLVVRAVMRKGTYNPSGSPTMVFDAQPNPYVDKKQAVPSLTSAELKQNAQGYSDTVEDNFTRSVHCLAMYYNDRSKPSRISGLMLVESSERNGLFRRIGTYIAEVSAFDSCLLEIVSIL